ncbi:MAG: hypothetical protein P4L33_05595 [Capsulimonadaceae bacterium]|nr:hypothetical protein [Capsulimonadaceae bacterium]
MNRPLSLRNLGIAGLLATIAAACPVYAQTQLINRSFPDHSRQVWVHSMNCFPTYNEINPRGTSYIYGDNYPLLLRRSLKAPIRPADTAQRFLECGITGVQVVFYNGNDYSGGMRDRMSAYDSFGLKFAPCLELDAGNPADGARVISDFIEAGKDHRSAAKMQEEPLAFVYSGRSLHMGAWRTLRETLTSKGQNVFLCGDIASEIDYYGNKLIMTIPPPRSAPEDTGRTIADYLSAPNQVFDSYWDFGFNHAALYDLIDAMNGNGGKSWPPRLFAGGSMPGYNREHSNQPGISGGYLDCVCTAAYRDSWNKVLAAQLQWNNVVTWNDEGEKTEIWPSSEWNWTRADITAFYSAQLRRVPYPDRLKTPQLYVTTPQRINGGCAPTSNTQPGAAPKTWIAEAMALNSSFKSAAKVTIQVIDASGRSWGKPVSAIVAPQKTGAATIELNVPPCVNGKNWIRVKATLICGIVRQDVVSAPILIYDKEEQTDDIRAARIHYYSIPARMALHGQVGLILKGSPLASGATATVVPPQGTRVRFAEVLQNTYQVENFYDSEERTTEIPRHPTPGNVIYEDNQHGVNTPASGFYVGRVIDEDEHVGYSDPVYVSSQPTPR